MIKRNPPAVVILLLLYIILFLRYYFRAEVVLFGFEVGRYWKITRVFPSCVVSVYIYINVANSIYIIIIYIYKWQTIDPVRGKKILKKCVLSVSENKTQLSPKSKIHSSQIFSENKVIYSVLGVFNNNIILGWFVIATSC